MSDMTADATTAAELPRTKTDWVPLALVPALALLALPFVGEPSTWVTLTVAGLAMGMMIFLMASGLTLVFGLMDIINFGHGVFISLGAYATLLVLGPLAGWAQADSVGLNLALLLLCILVAMAVTGVVGAVFERVIVRPVYGSHLKQILVTMGGLIVAEQAIHAIWGASPIPIPLPETLRGAFVLGDIVMERYRVVAVAVGLTVFVAMQLMLNRTRIGLLIRAGVENPEMVEALGYRIKRLFVSVFVAGSALAGLGGVMWAFYRQTLTAGMGMEVMVLVFIVIIIGGLGSVGGCFVGSILVALVANYVGFLAPKLALISNILVMALVLIWRPQGLFPVARR
ncbi:branched-chain amino acid ABC transporter permease [Microvirga subterranea]|uniref:Amino acid/amide ABC transporter membrane protein 1 (HAAT family) n=1 Tax=Microvirga subterranea TaxID=186651 RepID=A0A370HRA7_9HYPH|nr:branched-chain amino acid ABC transporter permease [Microvirga subterranea]RDI60830.1 amino acid/amide ABC transporter membrane protein 1 (HAAT family) [Microvirga subterranea]